MPFRPVALQSGETANEKWIQNPDGTVSPAIRQVPIAARMVTVPTNSTLDLTTGSGRVYAVLTDQQPIDLLDGANVVWSLRSTTNPVVFARPIAFGTSIRIRNPSLTTATNVHIQYEEGPA